MSAEFFDQTGLMGEIERSHSERDNLPPIRDLPEEIEKLSLDEIEIKSYVGGLVKSFERKAA